MKANELRIGNLIHNKNKKVVRVGIMSFRISKDLSPIPLTEEWLKRFGFDEFGRDMYGILRYEKGNVGISLNLADCFFYEGAQVDIKYVHQLQNLYHALTGEELNQNKDDE